MALARAGNAFTGECIDLPRAFEVPQLTVVDAGPPRAQKLKVATGSGPSLCTRPGRKPIRPQFG